MNIIPVAVIDINSGTVSGDMVISDLTIITLTLNSYSYNIQVGIIPVCYIISLSCNGKSFYNCSSCLNSDSGIAATYRSLIVVVE